MNPIGDWDKKALFWLITEGLVPLFGAGFLYLALGLALRVTSGPAKLSWKWKEWLDPMGWLYGAVIISISSGLTNTRAHHSFELTCLCYAAACVSILFLLAAMVNRGQTTNWKPGALFQIVVVSLVKVILYVGYSVHVRL